ncbi:MAG: response regulator [Prochlorothrix sp.]
MQPPRNPLPRILLVEDHIPNQAVIKAQLRILGFDCDTACNGLEGLQRLEAQDYDLILMDCKMPVMDGYEATRRIRQNPKTAHIPIIAITAYAFMSDRERCLALGMNDYLAKPYWVTIQGSTKLVGFQPFDRSPKQLKPYQSRIFRA